ncbi:TRAP transporter small permease [Parvibium lacunae]|uniref:TRAP transporter small permease protein n=1 Tax=Parvibium lacunae TaxID=1888893 RepID=A0A368L9C3_9BURK|nr:TRAP transporter small permease [Parvibium lacunae]RCS59839.1 TRAP transporter small permease [Parvibium lacunae]
MAEPNHLNQLLKPHHDVLDDELANRKVHGMRRFLDYVYKTAEVLAATCMFTILCLMIYSSLGRELNLPTTGVDDLTAWFSAAAVFLAIAATFKNGEMVRVGLWIEKLNPAKRHAIEIFTLSTATIACGYMLYAICSYVYQSYITNEPTQGLLVIPIWIPQMTAVTGVFLFFIAIVDELIWVLRGNRPTYVVQAEERLARGEFGEGA